MNTDIENAVKLLEKNGYNVDNPEDIKKHNRFWKKYSELTTKFINSKTIEEKEHFDKLLLELD